MRPVPHNSGFVLIVVLLVIVTAATALAATVRYSCQQALTAAERMRRLQLRWGMLSCRAVCLPRAELTLQDRPATDSGPLARVHRSVKLGDMTFHVIVGDEQAKADVNLLAARRGRRGLIEALRMLQLDQRRVLQTRLKPIAVKPNPANPIPAVYGSFEQLFDVGHPSKLVGTGRIDRYASDRITCWSRGRVNFKRADRRVLREVLEGILNETQIDALIRIRRDVPDCTLNEALGQLDLKKPVRKAAQSLLTDMSWCHSLWIVAEGRSRKWYQLHVARGVIENEEWSFAW